MPASLALYADPAHTQSVSEVGLGETMIEGEYATGEARPIFGLNNGTTVMRELEIATAGDGASKVQLAANSDGKPGEWRDPGAVLKFPDVLYPGDGFMFWARSMYTFSDHEGRYDFNFVVVAVSVA